MNQLLGYNFVPHEINVNVTVFDQQSNLHLQTSIDPGIPFNIFVNGIKEQIFAQRIQAQYEETIENQLGNGPNLSQNDPRSLQTLGFTNNCTLYMRLKLKGSDKYKEKRIFKVLVDLQFQKMELFIEYFNNNPVSFIFHDILIELFNNQKLKIDHPFAFFINNKEIEPFDIRQIKDFETNKKEGIIVKKILPNKQTNQDSIEKYKFALDSSKQIKPNLKKIIKIQYNNDMEIHVESDTTLAEILNIICVDLKRSQINLDQSKIYYVNDKEIFRVSNVYPIDNIKVDIQQLYENVIVFKIIGDFNIKINLRVTIMDKGQNYFNDIYELKQMNTSMTKFLQYFKYKLLGPNQINYQQDIIDQRDNFVEIQYLWN